MTSTTGICILCQNTGLDTEYLLIKTDSKSKQDEQMSMTFTFAINVLTIKDSQYQAIYKNQFDWDRVDDTKFKWIIDTKMIKKFENCCKGQKFESEHIYDDLWCVGIAPNGIINSSNNTDTDTDDVILYIQLCNKPIDINSITVGCQMNCIQLGIQTKYNEQSMGIRDDEFSKIQFNLMNKNEFMEQIKSIKELSIECEISIIKMSSENGLSRRSLSHSFSKISSPMAMERRSTRTSKDYSYNNETLV